MKTLFCTEFEKIAKSKAFRLAVLALVLVMAGLIVTEYQDVALFRENPAYRDEVLSWQEREQNVVTFASQSLREDTWLNPLQKEQTTRRIAIAEYRLENNIPKEIYKNVWWFFNDNAFQTVSTLVIVLTVLLGSVNIAGEYSGHTLRQMLLLPYRRWKLLSAKVCAIGTAALILYGVVFFMGLLSGLLLHGTNGISSQVVLYFGDQLTTMNMSLYSFIVVLLRLIDLAFYTVFVLLLCVLTQNVAVSAVVAGFTAALAVPVGNLLGSYYPALFYLPFQNLDFRRYLDFGTVLPQIEAGFNSTVIAGISPLLSAGIVAGTMALFVLCSFAAFKKQDI